MIELITNGFDEDDFNNHIETDENFNITHTGLFAADGNPETLWKVLADKCSSDNEFRRALRIRLVGKTDKEIIKSIEAFGLGQNLKDFGYQSHEIAVKEQRNASTLILPLRKEPEYEAVLPGKLFEYLGDFYCEVCEKSIDYYKPDVLGIVDDTAAWGNPFVSLDMFREFLVPQYKRLAQFAHDRDLVITYHNCGKCESFIDDMVNVVGINEWNPAQNCNDLAAIKAKYGNKLTLCGCINSSQTFIGEMTDEHIREIVWDVANKYAPGGGFQFMVTFIIPDRENNPEMVRREYFVNEVMEEVSHEFYKK